MNFTFMTKTESPGKTTFEFKSIGWLHIVETDPEQLTRLLIEQCQQIEQSPEAIEDLHVLKFLEVDGHDRAVQTFGMKAVDEAEQGAMGKGWLKRKFLLAWALIVRGHADDYGLFKSGDPAPIERMMFSALRMGAVDFKPPLAEQARKAGVSYDPEKCLQEVMNFLKYGSMEIDELFFGPEPKSDTVSHKT